MKICFATINGEPDYLGGYSMYHKNLIKYIKQNNIDIDISWVYFGDNEREYDGRDGVHYFEIKSKKINPIREIRRHIKLAKFFKNNDFDIINCIGGIWTLPYVKKDKQKIIHTYHGTTYYFNKNQLRRYGMVKRVLYSPILIISKLLDRPHEEADKIICVSDKVKKQVQNMFDRDKYIYRVIRTGVDLEEFQPRNKNLSKSHLGLNIKYNYGLYVGGGGWWGKGLDRALEFSEQLYKNDNNYRLLIIGADYEKCTNLIEKHKNIAIYRENIPRERMNTYYNVADIFFSVSRYEGGAPTMVTSEAMASGCLIINSEDSKQEILRNGYNAIILKDFNNISKYIKIDKEKIINNSMQTIKNLSLNNWGERYLKELGVKL